MKYIQGITLILLMMSSASHAEPYYKKNILKVCADPYMLPFSNKEEKGFENRIAELMAEKMGMELQYEFFPQRMGFIRNTLKKENTDGSYKCDLVINVPESFELASATDPYYTTTYYLAYKKGGKLDGLENTADLRQMIDDKGVEIKFGLTDRGPQQLWVFQNGLMEFMVNYQGHPGDAKVHPGQIMMQDLADDKIDVTIVWGPTAGYYAKEFSDKGEIVLLPMSDDKVNAEAKYKYSMSMAVRYGEKEWKEKVSETLTANMDEINKILTDFGVPLVK